MSRCLRMLAILFLTVFASNAFAYDSLHVFGDSFSDTGNVPPLQPGYYNNRHSNGPLWTEYLSTNLGFSFAHANNHAEARSLSRDALVQAKGLSAISGSALTVVWTGNNDLLSGLGRLSTNESKVALINISNIVETLVEKGARTVVIANLMDFTQTPVYSTNTPLYLLTFVQKGVNSFNADLFKLREQLSIKLPQTRIEYFDLAAAFGILRASAQSIGFARVDLGALRDTTLQDKSFEGPGANYLFWDHVHPTTKAHRVIANWFEAAAGPRILTSFKTLEIDFLEVGKTYSIETSPNLAAWANESTFQASSNRISFALQETLPTRFFRLRWMPGGN